MIQKYIKLRLLIIKRSLQDELSIAGIVMLLSCAILLYIYIFYILQNYTYGKYISLILFTFSAFSNCINRKDYYFLKIQNIKLECILIIENLLLASLFCFIYWPFIPLYLILSIVIGFIFKDIKIDIPHNIIRITPFIKGSFEWISAFRQYLIYVLIIDILFMIIAIIYNNYAFAQLSVISLNIAASLIFLKIESIEDIKQYKSPNKLLKAKFKQIIANTLIINSVLIILHIIFIPEQSVIILLYLILAIILISGNMLSKYVFIENDIFREIMQIFLITLFISSCVHPIPIILSVLCVLYLYYKAIKSLKEYYHD